MRRDYKLTLNQLRQGSGNIYKARAIAGREKSVWGYYNNSRFYDHLFFSFSKRYEKGNVKRHQSRERKQPASLSFITLTGFSGI